MSWQRRAAWVGKYLSIFLTAGVALFGLGGEPKWQDGHLTDVGFKAAELIVAGSILALLCQLFEHWAEVKKAVTETQKSQEESATLYKELKRLLNRLEPINVEIEYHFSLPHDGFKNWTPADIDGKPLDLDKSFSHMVVSNSSLGEQLFTNFLEEGNLSVYVCEDATPLDTVLRTSLSPLAWITLVPQKLKRFIGWKNTLFLLSYNGEEKTFMVQQTYTQVRVDWRDRTKFGSVEDFAGKTIHLVPSLYEKEWEGRVERIRLFTESGIHLEARTFTRSETLIGECFAGTILP